MSLALVIAVISIVIVVVFYCYCYYWLLVMLLIKIMSYLKMCFVCFVSKALLIVISCIVIVDVYNVADREIMTCLQMCFWQFYVWGSWKLGSPANEG